MKNKLSIKDSKIFMVAAVLVVGTISTIIPTTSFAQSYDQQLYEDPYTKDNKKSSVNIQKIKCINENTNVNGLEITEIPQNGIAVAEIESPESGVANENSLFGDRINFDKNLVNVCVNVNVNEQIEVDQTDPCLLCIQEILTTEQIMRINQILSNSEFTLGMTTDPVNSLEELCQMLNERGQVSFGLISNFLQNVNGAIQPEENQIPFDTLREVIQCLIDAGLVMPPSS